MTDTDATAIGVPADALQRLKELQPSSTGAGLYTSDLTVNEFLLVRQAGFRPRGLVFGSSIFHIGLQGRRWTRNQELANLTQALYSARELAMHRMEAEASVLEADGIVGVRLDIRYYDWGSHSAEFVAVGTAVSATDSDGWRTPAGAPFTSDLSGQDFWTLVQAGHAPVGLVLGNCVYHVAHRSPVSAVAQVASTTELPHISQALYEARELAMTRMQLEAASLGADGIVGVQLMDHSHVWGSHVIEFLAIGTAVRERPGAGPVPAPVMTLGLGD